MKRAQYTKEYKHNALDLVKRNSSLKGAARELGIDDRTLRRWVCQYNKPTLVSELEQVKWLEKEELLRCKDKQIRELENKSSF